MDYAEILKKAKARAEDLPYSGVLEPEEAYALMTSMKNVTLVDVRTHAEWTFVGVPENANTIEFKTYPGMQDNPLFLEYLKARVDPQNIVLFMCRSGQRSHAAAALAAQNGYSECFNIAGGFEGEVDANGHRSHLSGWKAKGLPWQQS